MKVVKMILRFSLRLVVVLAGLVLFIIVVSIAPVDRTPIQQSDAYRETLTAIDDLPALQLKEGTGFRVGYSKVNLTPSHPVATAGYGVRRGKLTNEIHDSLFVRAMVIDNGYQKAAIVSADLLIIPPTVTLLLEERLKQTGFTVENTFLGATHSHNSIGHWGKGLASFIYGDYNEEIVAFIADKIVESISTATTGLQGATLAYEEIDVPEAVRNRLIQNGKEDAGFKVLQATLQDSAKLVLMSFTAHATCLSSRNYALSRDYPGALVDSVEKKGYQFAMFIAGAVGSHTSDTGQDNWDCAAAMADLLSDRLIENRQHFQKLKSSVMDVARVKINLTNPQIKVLPDWKVRSWLFRATFGEYPATVNVLRIGDLVLLGTPCDYSGMLSQPVDSIANHYGLEPMITSFNGGYIGYVTPQSCFEMKHYETQLMNWYAPGSGEYIQECLSRLVLREAGH